MASAKTTHEADESGFDRTVDKVRDTVKDYAAAASETAADGISTLADQSADGIKSVAARVPQAQHWADEQIDSTRDRIRAEPIKMMAIAAAVGALFGAIFLRS